MLDDFVCCFWFFSCYFFWLFCVLLYGFFFFKQKTAYEMRISDWSSDVCSSDLAMGGGLGLSIHGSHRVVSEDLRMAMPETVLGLFPDVGGTWFLNRCPGAIGRYLALTGVSIGAADALMAGLATHHVPYAAFDGLVSALGAADRSEEHTS